MVAMINKSVLPVHHNIPFIGNISYMSQGLKYNIELLLFCKYSSFVRLFIFRHSNPDLFMREKPGLRLPSPLGKTMGQLSF